MFIKVKEAAALLSCCEKTIYRAVEEKRLPAIRWGRNIRIDSNAISSLSGEGLSRSSFTTKEFGGATSIPREDDLWE